MQCCATAPLFGGAEGIPFREFDKTSDYRTSMSLSESCCGSGPQAVEHIDNSRLRHDRAHAARLRKFRDEKRLASGDG
jgi:hypothetical protein